MALLENMKTNVIQYDDDVLNLSESLQSFSIALRNNNKDTIRDEIMNLLHYNIHTASKYNIDMKVAWYRWNRKAKNKKYES
jgi:hypothetical protein